MKYFRNKDKDEYPIRPDAGRLNNFFHINKMCHFIRHGNAQ